MRLQRTHFNCSVKVHAILTSRDCLTRYGLIIIILCIRARMALLSLLIIDLLTGTTYTCFLALIEMKTIRAFMAFFNLIVVNILWRTSVAFHFFSAIECSRRTFLAIIIRNLLRVFGAVFTGFGGNVVNFGGVVANNQITDAIVEIIKISIRTTFTFFSFFIVVLSLTTRRFLNTPIQIWFIDLAFRTIFTLLGYFIPILSYCTIFWAPIDWWSGLIFISLR